MRIKEEKGSFVIVDFSEAEAYKIACRIEEENKHKKILQDMLKK